MADDLGRKAVAGVAGRGRLGHRTRLRNQAGLGKAISLQSQPLKLTVPLRIPLTRLRLRVEFIDDPDLGLKMLADIRTMESMITSTLTFIRNEAAQEAMEQVDVAVLLQTVRDEFTDAGSDICYEGPSHCSASCRPQALQRALNNLIDNAVKFGGIVTARLEVNPFKIMMAIEDDGPGISSEQKEIVFKPFVRGDVARNNPEGVGLGLSLVRAIVQAHNGAVEPLERTPHGLCVRLSIPRRNSSS